jgi:predicted ATPase
MTGKSYFDFRSSELDPDLLSASFNVQTNWCVITGSSCSGKTTLIKILASNGFKTVPEAGRKYFERELAKGRTISEIRDDPADFTRQVYDIMLEHENGLRVKQLNFLDRALPDGFAFFRIAGLNPNDILSDCFQHRYAAVFLLDRLPYRKDGVRVADDETAEYLETWMLRDYGTLGYDVIRVPVISPEERFEFVIEKLTEKGII